MSKVAQGAAGAIVAAVAAIALVFGTAMPAAAAGSWSKTTSNGYYWLEISNAADWIYVATRLNDTNCNASGIGIFVTFYDDANNQLVTRQYWDSNGCNNGITSQGGPLNAAALSGKRSGWAQFDTCTGSYNWGNCQGWGSTYWRITG
jgi:hypothetical protein